MRRRSTFWSRAKLSSRSSGPSKPSRLTISSPSPGAMTSGPSDANLSDENPSAGGGLTGSFMLLRFNPVDAPTATVIGLALSPFRQERPHPPVGVGKARPAERVALAGKQPPPGPHAPARPPRHA